MGARSSPARRGHEEEAAAGLQGPGEQAMGASPAPGRPHPAVSTVLGEGPESRGNRSAPQAPLLVASRACQRPSHRGDRCGSLLGPGSAVPRKESRVEMHPPLAQPPGWAPDPVTKGLTPRKGGGCGRAPQGSPPPRLFLSHSLRLSRAPHGPGLCPLLCFPPLLTGLDRNAGLAASGVLSGSAPDTWTGEASRVWWHSPMTRQTPTVGRQWAHANGRGPRPGRGRPPSEMGRPGQLAGEPPRAASPALSCSPQKG